MAALTAAGLALTPVSAAAADREDIARALAGLAILGIVAKAASERDERRTVARQGTSFGSIDRFDDRSVLQGELYRPGQRRQSTQAQRFRSVALPERCLRVLSTARGEQFVYGQGCLTNNYRHANRLPQSCQRQVQTPNGVRTVYRARCLARDGWQVARR